MKNILLYISFSLNNRSLSNEVGLHQGTSIPYGLIISHSSIVKVTLGRHCNYFIIQEEKMME
uniref:Uncharacterized protein n=1 Tax=Rhizophora mucronata TaxID=61149 RepID=A0A2P2IWL7_RHIMU